MAEGIFVFSCQAIVADGVEATRGENLARMPSGVDYDP
jgi:hypothetical protein